MRHREKRDVNGSRRALDRRRHRIGSVVEVRDELAKHARSAVRRLHGTRFDRVLDSAATKRLRDRVFSVSPDEVHAVMDACTTAGVDCWLAGGWGVDALVGRQTRRHGDIDLCIDVVDDGEARACAALGALGYCVTSERGPSGRLFPERPVLRHPSGRVIDLLLVTSDDTQPTTAAPLVVIEAGSVTEGHVGGRTVPCISVELQMLAHTGFVPTDASSRNVALLCEHAGTQPPAPYGRIRVRRGSQSVRAIKRWIGRLRRLATGSRQATALVISVPEAVSVLSAVGSPELGGIGPHVTVLFPFVSWHQLGPHHRRQLRAIAASTPRFGFQLTRLAAFPGVLYVEPEPAAPFIDLTRAVSEHFPDYQPYGGEFEAVVPHLTVAYDLEPEDLAFTIEPLLPLESHAKELVLMVCDGWGRWTARERYPLSAGVR